MQASEELLDRAATSGANVPETFNAKAFRRSLNKTGRYTRQPTNDKESLALMDDHGVGYSLRGLVAQMKDNGGVWQQVNTAAKHGVASAAMCTSRCRLRGLPYVRPAVQNHSTVWSRNLVPTCTAGQGASARLQGDVTVKLAEAYGYCWGVERAVQMAYEARRAYPGQKLHITNEIIHNPSVNKVHPPRVWRQ